MLHHLPNYPTGHNGARVRDPQQADPHETVLSSSQLELRTCLLRVIDPRSSPLLALIGRVSFAAS
jgi:hypothetical protein